MAGQQSAALANRELRLKLEADLARVPEFLQKLPLRRGTTSLRELPIYEDWYFKTAELGHYDDYWKNPGGALSDYIDQYPDIPLFMFTSWYGHHPWANFVKYQALKERIKSPVKLVCGIWIHGQGMLQTTNSGDVEFGLEAALGE